MILFGATANKILNVVQDEMIKQERDLKIYPCDSLAETVAVANKVSSRGQVVLFSPASASFDLFKNFEDRGNKFKNIVNGL